jgi:hypothetical protein
MDITLQYQLFPSLNKVWKIFKTNSRSMRLSKKKSGE